eukprot:10142679-Alexandrium_andersonii.AAC.1
MGPVGRRPGPAGWRRRSSSLPTLVNLPAQEERAKADVGEGDGKESARDALSKEGELASGLAWLAALLFASKGG